jgi:hypothetical protein
MLTLPVIERAILAVCGLALAGQVVFRVAFG